MSMVNKVYVVLGIGGAAAVGLLAYALTRPAPSDGGGGGGGSGGSGGSAGTGGGGGGTNPNPPPPPAPAPCTGVICSDPKETCQNGKCQCLGQIINGACHDPEEAHVGYINVITYEYVSFAHITITDTGIPWEAINLDNGYHASGGSGTPVSVIAGNWKIRVTNPLWSTDWRTIVVPGWSQTWTGTWTA